MVSSEGSDTSLVRVRDFQIQWISFGFLDFVWISGFRLDFWISLGFLDFAWISGFHLDFIWISGFHLDFIWISGFRSDFLDF